MSKWIICLPLLSLLWVGCDKKDTGSATEAEATLASIADDLAQESETPTDLGFATRLPESVEFFASIYQPGDLMMGLAQVDIAEILFTVEDELDSGELDGLSKEEQREEIDDAIEKMNEVMVKDAFVCIGHGMAINIATTGDVYQDMQASQMKLVTMMISRVLKMEHPELIAEDTAMQELVADALSGMQGLDALLDDEAGKLAIPSVYAGCEPPSGKMDEWRDGAVQSLLSIADDQKGAEVYQFDKYGTTFKGVKLNISVLFDNTKKEMGGALKKELEEGLKSELGVDLDDVLEDALKKKEAVVKKDPDQAMWDRLQARWQRLSLIFVVGEVDGHLVFFVGKDDDALVLVDRVEDSLGGRSEFELIRGGKLLGAWYASDELLMSFQTWRGYEKIYRALARAFTKEELPNSQKIVRDFNVLADLEHQLVQRKADDYLLLLMLDEGVRIESVGGRQDVDLDFSQPLRLPAVADAVENDLFFKAHWRGNKDRQVMQMDYLERLVSVFGSVVEGGYLAFLEKNDSSADWFGTTRKMYDEILAPEVVRLWGGYRKLQHEALDSEVAVMVDLNGGLPRVPGIPPSFLKKGKVPRLLFARPVRDPKALADSYGDLAMAVEHTLEYTSVMMGDEIPMPDFVSSGKGNLTTWYYSFPMLTNDFLPGISVSDTLLMAGSSKLWAEEVYGLWEKEQSSGSGENGPRGAMLNIQFAPLWDFTDRWFDLAEHEEAQALTQVSF